MPLRAVNPIFLIPEIGGDKNNEQGLEKFPFLSTFFHHSRTEPEQLIQIQRPEPKLKPGPNPEPESELHGASTSLGPAWPHLPVSQLFSDRFRNLPFTSGIVFF